MLDSCLNFGRRLSRRPGTGSTGRANFPARWIYGFVAELAALGYAEPLVRAFLWCDPAELVAVGFTPCAAFQQTPGPRAGLPLGS